MVRQVGAGFEQMGCKAVPQGMRVDALIQSRCAARLLAAAASHTLLDVMGTSPSWDESPLLGNR